MPARTTLGGNVPAAQQLSLTARLFDKDRVCITQAGQNAGHTQIYCSLDEAQELRDQLNAILPPPVGGDDVEVE